MLQSNYTKTLSLTKDLEEFLNMTQQAGWLGPTKPGEHWTKVKDEWQYKGILDSKDEPTWEEMSEDWNAFSAEWSSSPADKRFEPFGDLVGAGTQSHHHSDKGSWNSVSPPLKK